MNSDPDDDGCDVLTCPDPEVAELTAYTNALFAESAASSVVVIMELRAHALAGSVFDRGEYVSSERIIHLIEPPPPHYRRWPLQRSINHSSRRTR